MNSRKKEEKTDQRLPLYKSTKEVQTLSNDPFEREVDWTSVKNKANWAFGSSEESVKKGFGQYRFVNLIRID